MTAKDDFIPALSLNALTPYYDRLLSASMRETTIKQALIKAARIQPGQRLLDVGVGTATLSIMIKQEYPAVEVVGLDIDERILAIARQKVEKLRLAIQLDQASADRLPYEDAAFERAVSSLVIHHLTREQKQRAFREVYRVLKAGGSFTIVDFGPPRSLWAKLLSPLMNVFEEVDDNMRGRLPEYLARAGFAPVLQPAFFNTIFGTLVLYEANKPA